MARDWIKWEKGLIDKPEVVQMARWLSQKHDRLFIEEEIAARLMRVWEWADTNTTDGSILGIGLDFVDRKAGIEGFSSAMIEAGWLLVDGMGLLFPNFTRHNGNSAKTRALEAERKRLERLEEERMRGQVA